MIWVVLLQYSPKNPLLLLLFKEEERDRERIRKSKPCKNPFLFYLEQTEKRIKLLVTRDILQFSYFS
jgi:hypothetical protein